MMNCDIKKASEAQCSEGAKRGSTSIYNSNPLNARKRPQILGIAFDLGC